MAKRGRRSAAEEATDVATISAPVQRAERPAPPAELSDFEASVWVRVVDAMPAEWFGAEVLDLLVSYCKHVKVTRTVDEELNQFDPEWLKRADGLSRYKMLTDIRDKHSRVLMSLATKMRLTPQARILPQTAGRRMADQPKEAPPWLQQ